nr:hypothetical protein [Anaerolineae bacterium]
MPDSAFNVQPQEPPIEQSASPSISITLLGLRARARNVLLDAGIHTVGDVLAALAQGDETLTGLKGFGPRSLVDLKQRLQEQGFALPDEPAPPPEGLDAVTEREDTPEAVDAMAAPDVLELEEEAPEEVSPAPVAVEAAPEDAAGAGLGTPPAAQALVETPSLGQRLAATLAQAREQLSMGAWLYGVIGILVIVALFLPPVSLLQRLGITGYTTLDAAHSSISHPDGLTLSVDPEAAADPLRVRLESVPRLEFLEGSAGGALRRAVEALPDHLTVKSGLYQIHMRGDPSQPVMIDVA